MSEGDNFSEVTKQPNYSSKSETQRVFSVFDSFKKDAEETRSSLTEESSDQQPVLTMSSLGQLGRFGNQLFQYAFLRISAERTGAKVQCPPWIGQTLFGHKDNPISKRLPPAIESWKGKKNMFDLVPEFIPYIEKKSGMLSTRIDLEALESGIVNVDLWGYFQVETQHLKPYKEYLRSLFQPVNDLKFVLEDALNNLYSKGKTIIGIHIRRGDYIREPMSRYTFVVPSKWWCQWLDEIWNQLEDPVLFLCSDDLESVIDDFKKFSPVTSKDLDVKLPQRMKNLDLEFYIDFYLLTKSEIVGISNSTFSFFACLLNENGRMFIRPYRNSSIKLTTFDPWNSQPLLHMGQDRSKFFKSWWDALCITYITLGFWVTIKSMFIYLPKTIIKIWGFRTNLAFKTKGIIGVFQSILCILGWRSAWKKPSKFT